MRGAAIVTLVLLMIPQASLAGEGSANDRELRSRNHFEVGATRYRLGDFAGAVVEFKAALELVNRASTLFNIAQCYRQMKVSERAIFYYRLYLAAWDRQHPGTQAPNREAVNRLLEKLTEDVERARAGRALKRQQTGPAPAAPFTSILAQPASSRKETSTEPIRSPVYKKWWFWSALGVVAAGTVTAIALGSRSQASLVPRGTLDTLELK